MGHVRRYVQRPSEFETDPDVRRIQGPCTQKRLCIQQASTIDRPDELKLAASLFALALAASPVFAEKAASNGDWEARFNDGVMYGRQGDWDKAIENLKRAAELKPGRQEIYTDLSLAYAEKKDFANAVDYAQKAVNASP